MVMIELSDGCYVSSDCIAEVKINEHHTHVIVRMKDGVGHFHEPRHGEMIYTTLGRLIDEINAAEK